MLNFSTTKEPNAMDNALNEINRITERFPEWVVSNAAEMIVNGVTPDLFTANELITVQQYVPVVEGECAIALAAAVPGEHCPLVLEAVAQIAEIPNLGVSFTTPEEAAEFILAHSSDALDQDWSEEELQALMGAELIDDTNALYEEVSDDYQEVFAD